MMCKYAVFLALALLSVLPSFAQEREIQLLKVSGGELMVSDGEKQSLYQPESISPEGLALHRGNMLQTGAGSFAELRIGGITLLVAENTSVAFRGDFLEFIYGRLRLYGSGTAFTVRTAAADLVFEDGDTGLDYAYETFRAGFSEPVLRVYGFSGEKELVLRGDRASAPGYKIAETGMLSLRYTAAHSYAERGELGEDIINYWNQYGGGPRLSLPVKEVEKNEPEIQIRYETPDFSPYKAQARFKNASILTGTLFVFLGGAVTAFGHYGPKQITGRYNNAINAAGYSSIGLGAFVLFGSMLINPQYPAAGSK
jgi:hypothetical protein